VTAVPSRRPVRLVPLLALALTLGACSHVPPRAAAGGTYVVRAGDTLYRIARSHGLDYRDLARWNGIGPEYRIVPGQVLVLAPGPAARAASAPARAQAPSEAAAAPPPPTPAAPEPPRGTLPWTWPTDGAVTGPVERPSGGVGLAIAGQAGQEVRAAAPGRVVYTGSGLRAYGELVIVKHDDAFLTAYGHNAEVYVREGDEVEAGQRIAAMGLGPGGRPMLYFELRYLGRPVDPRPLLPAR
jgi:lipoprotein NlpD